MGQAIERHGAPEYLHSDNGSEFIAKIVQKWFKEKQIKTLYIDPGSPWKNGFVESFHGRLRTGIVPELSYTVHELASCLYMC